MGPQATTIVDDWSHYRDDNGWGPIAVAATARPMAHEQDEAIFLLRGYGMHNIAHLMWDNLIPIVAVATELHGSNQLQLVLVDGQTQVLVLIMTNSY